MCAAAAAATVPSEDEYERLERLGHGLIADVYRARVRKSGQEVAIKVVDLGDVDPESGEFGPIIEEIQGLSRVSCPHLSHYLDAHVIGSELWVVVELFAGGSVADLMRARGDDAEKQRLTESEIAYIISEVLKGLTFLHERDVPHSGLKASNVLVARGGGIVLTDYGVFEQLQHHMTKRDTFLHSPYWMAPEIISQGEAMPFSLRSDIWSLGITCIELALGKPPFAELHPMKVRTAKDSLLHHILSTSHGPPQAIFNIPTSEPARLPDDGRFSPEFRDFVA
jgi:serine/threonine-protein kinase 24/25/MST4